MSRSSSDLSRQKNALYQARLGRRVIPVTPDPALELEFTPGAKFRKKPLINEPYAEATIDPAKIRRWFRRWPDMNYGIVGGKESGIIILDADLDEMADEKGGWRLTATETFGLVIEDFKLTFDKSRNLVTDTPSDSLHLFLEFPEGYDDSDFPGAAVQHKNLGRGMDLKFARGWVMGPGSSWLGKQYVMHDLDAPLVKTTSDLVAAISKGAPRQKSRRSQVRKDRKETTRSVADSRYSNGAVRADPTGLNPEWMHRALFGSQGEITKLEKISPAEGARDSGVFQAARAIGGLVLADGSGISKEQALSSYITAASHTIGGDWTYADIYQKWIRAVGGVDLDGKEWVAEAEVRVIPAPKRATRKADKASEAQRRSVAPPQSAEAQPATRKPGRPRKENPAEKGKYAWAWLNGELDRAAVEDFLVEKHHIHVDAAGSLWYYEPVGVYKPLTKVEGEGAPRRTIKAILGNRYTTTWVNNVISGILEDRTYLPVLETERTLHNAHLIYLRNGRYNTRSDAFETYTPENAGTFQLPITYDPDATCPGWNRQFALTMPTDAGDYPKQMLASVLLPTSTSAAIWMLGTRTNSGKSFLIWFIENYLIGKEFVAAISPHDLNSKNSHLVSDLQGMYANVSSELGTQKLIDVQEIKKLTSGGQDSTQPHAKYKRSSKFAWFGSMIFSMNQELEVSDHSGAWDRRAMYLPFPNDLREHPDADRDFDRKGRYTLVTDEEVSGLFNEIVRAAHHVQEHGFTVPESAQRMRREFETPPEARPIVKWLHDEEGKTLKIDLKVDREDKATDMKVERPAAYKAFKTWATANGYAEGCYPGRNTFFAYLTKVFGKYVHNDQGDWFLGLQLTSTGKQRARARAVESDLDKKRSNRAAVALESLANDLKADLYSGEISEALSS